MTQPFSEPEFHDLLELETILDDLENDPRFQQLRQRAEQILVHQRRRVLSGDILPEDYTKLCWQIRGAEWVLGISQETRQIVSEYRRQQAEREAPDDAQAA